MANHSKGKQHNEPMRTQKQIHVTGAKRGEMRVTVTKSRLVLVLHPIGWEGGANFLNQSQCVVKQNQSNSGINTELKKTSWLVFFDTVHALS